MHSCSDRNDAFSPARQRGDVLLEAMLGVLITALMGAGMAHVASRIMSSQHDAAVDTLLVNQMRNQMQVRGLELCGQTLTDDDLKGLPAALKTEGFSLSVDACDSEDLPLEIAGQTVVVAQPGTIAFHVEGGPQSAPLVSSRVPLVAVREGDGP